MKKRIISAVLSAAMLGTSVFSVPFVSAETTNNEQIEKLLESFIEQNYKGDARVYEENDFVHVEFRKTSANEPYFDTTAISEDFDQFFKENNIDSSLVVIGFLEGTSIISNAEKLGDINLNGTIDVTDLTELSLALLGDMELTADGKKAADVDNDDAVTLADLAKLRQFLSKKIPSLDDAGISDKSAPNASEPTGVVFEVRSLAKYAELKDALTKNDEELEKFFSTIGGGKKDRETASVFVEYVDSLSLLDFLPGKIIWIHYDKRDSYETIQVTVESDSGEWIRYQYNLSDKQTTLTNTAVNKTTVLDNPVQNDDGSIILFSKSERPHTSGIGEMISIYGKINGIDVNIVYRTLDSANFSLDNFLSSKLVKIDDFTKYENEVKPIENHNTTVYSSTFNSYFELSENIVKTLSYWEEEMTQERAVTTYVSRLMFKAEDLNYIKVPKFADNDLKLIDSDGIVLNSKDLYGRPALIFNYDNNVSVKLTDVESERIDFDQVDTSAFIEKMNSICEDKELLPLYDDVRVEKTEIKGRTAEVLFGSNKGDSNVYAVFVYDDYLVTLCCSQEDIESGLLSSFRLKELELSEQKNSNIINEPPASNTFLFDSYDDLYEALTEQDSYKVFGTDNNGELFDKTIAAFKNNTVDLYVPAIDEDVDVSNIALMTTDLYKLPWIWYHCKASDNDVSVRIAYPGVIENPDLSSAKTYYEVLKMIAPDAPNPDNYANYESYQKIYESEICLANDKKVGVMISELKDNSKVYVMFNYEGVLVNVYADKSVLTESFWSRFSLAKY